MPAEYDAEAGCARCVASAWPVADATEADDGDVIVEVAINRQQFSVSCKHFLFQDARSRARRRCG